MGAELASLLLTVIQILSLLIFARAIFSWFDPRFTSQIGRVLYQITEPIIAPIRQVLPPMGMLDLSVLVALVLLRILQQLIRSALIG
jgi:YggT family protein